MRILRLTTVAFYMILFFSKIEVFASQDAPAVVERDYVLSAGAVSDGEYIWTIPYETGSFAKVNALTGKKENLSEFASKGKLDELSGYLSGALYEDSKGDSVIYLAPYEVSKPIVRINLSDMSIDYPFRDVGYYFGSCQVTSEKGKDYLWLIPSKVKPNGASSETEIVKLNITDGIKEQSITTKINGKEYAFSDSIQAGEYIWLLPAEEGQPLIKMNTNMINSSLEAVTTEMINSWKYLHFSRITTGVFDGNCIWFVCEDVSFALNNSVLARCDQSGVLIEKYPLTKSRFTKAVMGEREIFLFSGLEGRNAECIKIDIENGAMSSFQISEKKNYIVSEVFSLNGSEPGFFVFPSTRDGKKMPVLKIFQRPILEVTAETREKIYRDYGDFSKGVGINIDFSVPEGYMPGKIFWFVEEEANETDECVEAFNSGYKNSNAINKRSEDIKSLKSLTILAQRNGNYRFMMEVVSEDSVDNDGELFCFGSVLIDNIYERLPIEIARYDIENWQNALIENVTHLKNFGAAFSYDGKEFIKIDAPMELIPAREVYANGVQWELELPKSHLISIGGDEISPDRYFAEIEIEYRARKSEMLDENIKSEGSDNENSTECFDDNETSFVDDGEISLQSYEESDYNPKIDNNNTQPSSANPIPQPFSQTENTTLSCDSDGGATSEPTFGVLR